MTKIIFTGFFVLLLVFLLTAGCAGEKDEPDFDAEPIGGLIYSLEQDTILVVAGITDAGIPREEWFEAGKRAVYFTITDDTVIDSDGETVSPDRLARGQKVKVWHEGFLAESYPEQGTAVRIVIVETPLN